MGVQCVDCVREQNKDVRTARTAFGGELSSADGRVTKVIIGLCVVLYAVQFVAPGLYDHLALVNAPDVFPNAFAAGNWWQPLTSAFLHASSPMHLLFNMYALYVTGPYLEGLLGRARFIALYLLSALGGAVGATLLPFTENTVLVGASGAVFGLFAATFIVSRRLGRQAGQVAVLIAINLALGFVFPNVSWQGHVGGLLAGGAAAAVLVYAPKANRSRVQWAGLAVLGLVLVALLVLAAARMSLGAPFPG